MIKNTRLPFPLIEYWKIPAQGREYYFKVCRIHSDTFLKNRTNYTIIFSGGVLEDPGTRPGMLLQSLPDLFRHLPQIHY